MCTFAVALWSASPLRTASADAVTLPVSPSAEKFSRRIVPQGLITTRPWRPWNRSPIGGISKMPSRIVSAPLIVLSLPPGWMWNFASASRRPSSSVIVPCTNGIAALARKFLARMATSTGCARSISGAISAPHFIAPLALVSA